MTAINPHECPICLNDEFEKPLPCICVNKHRVCGNCLSNCTHLNPLTSCPVCRTNLRQCITCTSWRTFSYCANDHYVCNQCLKRYAKRCISRCPECGIKPSNNVRKRLKRIKIDTRTWLTEPICLQIPYANLLTRISSWPFLRSTLATRRALKQLVMYNLDNLRSWRIQEIRSILLLWLDGQALRPCPMYTNVLPVIIARGLDPSFL